MGPGHTPKMVGQPVSEEANRTGRVRKSLSAREQRLAAIEKGLNDTQCRAATHRDGPLVVFAGAGSGKTRIITHRIAWLIESGVHPWEILAVTFTNKAAAEMRHRVDSLTPYGSRVLISTFHSACARWLREFAPELGFSSDFTIYDDADSLSAIKTVLAGLNVDLDDDISPKEFKAAINRVKTMAILPNDERLQHEYADLLPEAGPQVYRRYQEYLAECNAMDFGDLILNVLLLLRRNEHVKNTMQQRYRYILVDEYQDTNRTQFELIARLADSHKNLFVVGDDDQSIYSWRGAVPSNIIDFDKVYPKATRITLEQNYRCSGHVVRAAGAMVANNKKRVPKELFTDNEPGDPINYRLESDNDMEAWWVVDTIGDEQARFPYGDIAIFYRTNSQSRILEDVLRRENIPYQIFGTVRFYDRMEIKDIMAYMRVIVNPRDDVSLKRIINTPPKGIGKKAIETIEHEASMKQIPMLATIFEMVDKDVPRLGAKLKKFAELVRGLKVALSDLPLDEVVELILDATAYKDYIEKKHTEQAQDKMDNIHELGAALADFSSENPTAGLGDWLQAVTLSSSETESAGGVSMMTLHMAKGLEYNRVYIVGLEENLLPHRNSLDTDESLEEERRLFYVGMTRAKQKLSLTGAHRRRTFNTWTANRPSRFLMEIPSEHLEAMTVPQQSFLESANGTGRVDMHSMSSSNGLNYDYSDAQSGKLVEVGVRVEHPTYGSGIVEAVVEEFGSQKATVRFDEFGLRKASLHHLSPL